MIEIYSEKQFPLNIAIALEEMGVPYKVFGINQFTRGLSPIYSNQTYIVDTAPLGYNESFHVYGHLPILDYLAEKYNMLLPDNSMDFLEVKQWMNWYVSFVEYLIRRPQGVVDISQKNVSELGIRFFQLNKYLEKKGFIGRSYSIADILMYPAYKILCRETGNANKFENLVAWATTIEKRPATIRAVELMKQH